MIPQDPAGQTDLSVICKTSIPQSCEASSTVLTDRVFMAETVVYDSVLPALVRVANIAEPLPWPRSVL